MHRRDVLVLIGGLSVTGLAGCLGGDETDECTDVVIDAFETRHPPEPGANFMVELTNNADRGGTVEIEVEFYDDEMEFIAADIATAEVDAHAEEQEVIVGVDIPGEYEFYGAELVENDCD